MFIATFIVNFFNLSLRVAQKHYPTDARSIESNADDDLASGAFGSFQAQGHRARGGNDGIECKWPDESIWGKR